MLGGAYFVLHGIGAAPYGKLYFVNRLIAALTVLTCFATAQSINMELTSAKPWVDTGIKVLPGALLRVTATGSIQTQQARQAATADGLPRGWKDLLRTLPLNDAGRGAVIGRIGEGDFALPFLIGSKREFRAATAGEFYVGLNLQNEEAAEGSFQVRVELLEPGKERQVVVLEKLPGIDAALFAQVPRRVQDPQDNLGDMVNFLLIGNEDGVTQAFQSAGWVRVDRSKSDAVLHGLAATLTKQAYVGLPMSELYLFGRAQDYGYAHAEPFKVAASRHHLRLWRAPFDVNGQPLWIGAATHDIGFDKDQRNGRLTHKIDPTVDLERDYVKQSLLPTGLIESLAYYLPAKAVTQASTATGETFTSDGRVLVLVLGKSPY